MLSMRMRKVELLPHKKQFRVTSHKIAENYFQAFMKAGKMQRGYKVRFIPMPEKCAIEVGADSEYDMNIIVRALKNAKIIRYEIPFEVNKVIKMVEGRREGRDFG